uniref:Uncharacterized protein n=1 Tax=Rhodnius prolixus TaxID=13249 RepID=T1I0V4_RHOPR
MSSGKRKSITYYIIPCVLLFLSHPMYISCVAVQVACLYVGEFGVKEATRELAHALLKIAPVISINGTISDEIKDFRLKFSCNVQATSTTMPETALSPSGS